MRSPRAEFDSSLRLHHLDKHHVTTSRACSERFDLTHLEVNPIQTTCDWMAMAKITIILNDTEIQIIKDMYSLI